MVTAILFDLDGTIVNTDPIHYQAWQQMLWKYNIEIDEKFYKSRISGRLNPEIVKDILPELSSAAGREFADEKEALFRQLASHLQPLNGFAELIAWTELHQLKRALVTNAPRLNAEFMLEVLGITESFHQIVLADDCVAGKPDPAPYQVALGKLGISAEKAIALEDSPSGIRAAVGAGIRTIGIASTHDPDVLQEVGSFMAIHDFTDLHLWTLLNSLIEPDLIRST
ncbi:HAD-superfamily hydrolase subfamily IA, variant 3 [Trichormus variabilis ATCC 29413]|uniref:HAD-superfamily hydrolase subfamily IA, variant 3 n=2 Tax=Anabaena variabilis TaxID=264691 RepID=Q3M459_TRIV2|nr:MULTISPECIES: HAD-IA family hydrolase [Nostocaceae]ABA24227.1 HAD-superfamily hydrolase subfamily IA, variant 3 [Trichormus variabilis ATCC 29413]MBC1214045.1 HAD-IA family hydrolase [Trichormus variabilis ARAD]MBC1254595.1 HAD-IA family hydrolase [Trichormus variabilis V5]MBC1270314.1 HAD-IA family hydrolase [Trichormus variabilis FSR]MBC1302495.1 HAD-IA family hydrolase [Trichormus variabilis N2B]